MKTKIVGLASTALLLLAPISGAFSSVAESQVVQAENNWDYDTANPELGEYDRLLQNAGPSDGQIDWYPAEHFASSKNIRPSLLVKQLIDLSIATNNANSNARKVLFNDTTGVSKNSNYQETYSKYKLALGFIAQLLAFNNEKTGKGAYLKQGFESEDGENPGGFHSEDKIAETQKTPDPAILGIPAIGEGVNISDVLGRAFFGNADDAYAQLYVNGYDNTVQNAPNIIRETTTSITIVAQSKLTGRKATAIFKLNNKTFNNLPKEVLLENDKDNSPSFAGAWGHKNIPDDEEKNLGDSTDGTFNQRSNLVTGLTDDQKRLLSNGGSSAWVDPKTGSGTIVVPRGTSAAEIAKKIKQLGYKSNYNISNVAPMKAIHGDYYGQGEPGKPAPLSKENNSYNVRGINGTNLGSIINDHDNEYAVVADPRENKEQDTDVGFKGNFSNSLLKSPLNTSKTGNPYDNGTAQQILNQGNVGAGTTHSTHQQVENMNLKPWPAYALNDSVQASEGDGYSHSENSVLTTTTDGTQLPAQYNGMAPKGGLATYQFGGADQLRGAIGGFGGNQVLAVESKNANDDLGNVVHAFEPGSGEKDPDSPFKVREAWDDTHAIFGMAPFTGLTEEEIKNQIANNGSFDNTSGAQLKKSFTFNMPLNNTVMKSYRNPYSTVISTALPFSKSDNGDFKQGEQYNRFGGNGADMNDNTSTRFSGDYLDSASGETPPINPWYENSDGYKLGGSPADSAPVDVSGSNMNINASPDPSSTRRSLHLSDKTWSDDKSDYENTNAYIGLHNVKNDLEGRNTYATWINDPGGRGTLEGKGYDLYDATGEVVPGKIDSSNTFTYPSGNRTTTHDQKINGNLNIVPGKHGDYIDAHNEKYGNSEYYKEYAASSGSLWVSQIPSAQDVYQMTNHKYNPNNKRTVRHLQLAKNVGYVLINRADLSEQLARKLSQYQIPAKASGPNKLDGIANHADFGHESNRPEIPLVNDDPTYRGGLLGVQSIRNNDNSRNPRKQDKAGSIYERTLNESAELLVPRRDEYSNEREGIIKNDAKGSGSLSRGQFATDTDLHYGLAWNDSSDLPQVKIRRSLNVQYLVPISVARTAATEYQEVDDVVADTSTSGSSDDRHIYYFYTKKGYKRTITTRYSDYKLFLGNVKLADYESTMSDAGDAVQQNGNDIGYYHISNGEVLPDGTTGYNFIYTKDAIKDILPVNNQIAYTRIDDSQPHYDSELFDHGSNTKSVTVKQGDKDREFVGNTEEKDRLSDLETDRTKFVGSSDDYSIGIVKAPSQFFRIKADGSLEYTGGDIEHDTENAAGSRSGMTKMADTPENNNGMRIGDVKSYATLAQAYNVEINGNKAVGKADDNAKNKGDRVALVQQLLDNGGKAGEYYYIPSLPRLYEKWNEARINVVVYDKAAVPAPSKAETKPSFSTTDVSTGNDPFNVNLRPYTTVYDDGAVLKESDVPQNFKNLLTRELVAGNTDLVTSDGQVATEKLQQILVGAFLNSWQQNDGSFNQTDTGAGVNSPLYLYGGFGISNSDSKNSYSQWPDGYTTPNLSSSKYHEAVTNYPGDFYRGGKDLKTTGATVIKGIPATALKADVSKVDLSKAGTYPVVYTYTNPSNDKDTASITVPVTVTDGAAPVFAFQGGSDLTIKVGESFDRSAFKVVGSWQIFNKYQGDYDKLVNYEGIAKNSKGEPDVTISGDVDTQTPGIYQLTYKATSIGGAVTTMNRNITVLPKETTGSDWKVSDFTSVGYVNYVPNYGINVWNAPAGTFTGQRLTHGTSWKIFQKAVNSQGKVYYQVGKNQWIDGTYVSFTPVSTMQPLNGIVTINYVRGYGVNLWKAPKTTGGYYEGRKLQNGTKWKVFGIQDGFYKVGGNQWIQAKYAKFQAR